MAHKSASGFLAVTLSASLLVSGCGGGGGDSANTMLPLIAITSGNAQSIAVGASGGVSGAASIGSQASGGATSAFAAGALSPLGTTLQKPRFSGIAYRGLQEVFQHPDLANSQLASAAQISRTNPCLGGGSMSLSINVASTSIASGDSAAITYRNCREGIDTLNGTVSVVFRNIAGVPFNESGTPNTVEADFEISLTTSSAVLSGTMAFSAVQASPEDTTITLSFPSFFLRSDDEVVGLENFFFSNQTVTGLSLTHTTTIKIRGRVSSRALGGSIDFRTPGDTGLIVTHQSNSPQTVSGSIAIGGANSTSLLLSGGGSGTGLSLSLDTGSGSYSSISGVDIDISDFIDTRL